MAYTDDAVRSKLSALNETQEAIVTVAQWIMFHKRQADRTVHLWAQRLAESASPKRLNLIYLANEVVQQSKARKRTEFVAAFQPVIAESTALAFKSASVDIQQKVRRVVDVWRQRAIFNPDCQQDIENRINDLDRRGTGKRSGLGGSLFASSASSSPPEYQALITSQSSLTKLEVISNPTIQGAGIEWNKFNDPNAATPSPPVQAARLGALLKTLANAEGTVAETLKARKSLVDGLEALLNKNKEELVKEEEALRLLNTRKVTIESKKNEVEEGIMRGLAEAANGGGTPSMDPPRPEVESLTPPPPDIESITPTGTPVGFVTTTGADVVEEQPTDFNEPPAPAFDTFPVHANLHNGSEAGPEFGEPLPTLAREASPGSAADPRIAKRRKISAVADAVDEFAGFAEGGTGIDADVEAMLG